MHVQAKKRRGGGQRERERGGGVREDRKGGKIERDRQKQTERSREQQRLTERRRLRETDKETERVTGETDNESEFRALLRCISHIADRQDVHPCKTDPIQLFPKAALHPTPPHPPQ